MYKQEKGVGVNQGKKEAVKWYLKAAEQGLAKAQNNLGVMYAKGEGTSQDKKEAVKWYRKAAEQGYTPAQVNLGLAYYNGNATTKDNIYAHMWWNISASTGDDSALKNIDIIEKDLVNIFKKNGIEKILTKNKKFDPNLHQAMSEIEDEKSEVGSIIDEIQAGYMLSERLLRPALVSVSKKKEEKKQEKD